MVGSQGTCKNDNDCENGLFCARGLYCEPYFYLKDGDRRQVDERQCISGMALFNVNGFFCRSVGYTKYGPFRNRVTNRKTFIDIP